MTTPRKFGHQILRKLLPQSAPRPLARLVSGGILVAGIVVPLSLGEVGASASSTLPPTGTIYTLNQSGDSVVEISPSGSVVGTISGLPANADPSAIVVSPDDTSAWVSDTGTDQISEINLETNTVTSNFSLPTGAKPTALQISNGSLYVLESGSSEIAQYSIPSFALSGTHSASSTLSAFAFGADGSSLAAVSTSTSPTDATVDFIDPTNLSGTISTQDLGTAAGPFLIATVGQSAFQGSYVVAEAGAKAVICASYAGGCSSAWSSIPLSFTPTAITENPAGTMIVVSGTTSSGSGVVDVISDLGSSTPTQNQVGVGSSPDTATFSYDGSVVLVGNASSNSLSEISIDSSGVPSVSATISGVGDPVSVATTFDVLPTPSFTETVAAPGQSVTFDASGSPAGTSPITSYQWNFGDGTTQTVTSPQIQHVFATPGDHTVSLTVTDAAGSTASTSNIVGFSAPSGHAMAYVTENGSSEVAVVDTQSSPPATIGMIPLEADPSTCDVIINVCNAPVTPQGIASSPDFSEVYVAVTYQIGEGVVQNQVGFVDGNINVISATTNAVTQTIPIIGAPQQLVVSPDGTHLYVVTAGFGPSQIATVDLTTSPPTVTYVNLPGYAYATDVAITPNGSLLGVTASTSYNPPGGALYEYPIANDVLTSTTPTTTVDFSTAVPNSLVMTPQSAIVTPSSYNTTTNIYSFASIDLATGNTNYSQPLTNAGDNPDWITLSPDDSTVQMTVNGISSSYVAVRSVATGATLADVPVNPSYLIGIAYTPGGKSTYAIDDQNGQADIVDPYTLTGTVNLYGPQFPGATDSSVDAAYVAMGKQPPPQPSTPPTTVTTTTPTTPTTVVAIPATVQPSSAPPTTVIVPAVHTGEPWNGRLWWWLVALAGLFGVVLFRGETRPRGGARALARPRSDD